MPINYSLYESIDDVSWDHAVGDRIRDDFQAYKMERGWDVSVMPDGTHRPFYPGMGMPEPETRASDEDEARLEAEFLAQYRPAQSVEGA